MTKAKQSHQQMNGRPTFRRTVKETLAAAGGVMKRSALHAACREKDERLESNETLSRTLTQMKHDKQLAYRANGPDYDIKLTSRAVLDVQVDQLSPPPVVALPVRPARPQQMSADVDGVAIHMVGGNVTLYVEGERHKFGRGSFAKTADFFSMLMGK